MADQRVKTYQFLFSRWAIAIVITHLWSFITFFYALPAIIRKMNITDTLALFSYNQTFALIESIVLMATMLSLQQILSIGTEKNHPLQYIVLTTGFALVFIWLHFIDELSNLLYTVWSYLVNSPSIEYTSTWVNSPSFIFASLSILAIFLVIYTLIISRRVIQTTEQTRHFASQLMEKFNTLAAFYLFIDLIGFVNIAIRNIL